MTAIRTPQPLICSSARSSASASLPVSRYSARSEGSPKSGWNEPSKPPTKPFTPATPTSAPSTEHVHASPSSTSTSPARSAATNSSWRFAGQSWVPITATTRRSVSARQRANSPPRPGAPGVGMSPAMTTRAPPPLSRAAAREQLALLGVAVRRHVAGDDDEVRLAVEPGERAGHIVAVVRVDVDVAGRGDTDAGAFAHERMVARSAERGNETTCMADHSPELDEVLDTLKKCAAALRDAGIPYMLGGGVAAWSRGGPESVHDVDLMIKTEDADRALDTLASAGLRPERPPEEWLVKAWDEHVLVDLIYQPRGMEIDDGAFERAEVLNVNSMEMPVMALEDVISTKLLALNERWLDYDQLLQ